MNKANLVQIFLSRCKLHPERPALYYKSKGANRYFSLTWAEWQDKVEKAALGLHALGVRKGDRVAILSENRPEWAISDLAVLSLGAITVPIYPTSSPQDVSYLLQNAGVQTLLVSSLEHLNRLQRELEDTLKLKHVILFDPHHEPGARVVSYSALLEQGRIESLKKPPVYEALLAEVTASDLATIIYTSGTTGPPKGVMLTHANFIANCEGAEGRIKVSEKDTALSFLPLSHVFERLAGYYFLMYRGASIAYAENMLTVPENMREVRPTICAAVPRFYEKVYARILEKVQASPVKKKLFDIHFGNTGSK
jgi:long-chain acyl-CoA synthetase